MGSKGVVRKEGFAPIHVGGETHTLLLQRRNQERHAVIPTEQKTKLSGGKTRKKSYPSCTPGRDSGGKISEGGRVRDAVETGGMGWLEKRVVRERGEGQESC